MLTAKRIVVGPLSTNCYVVYAEDSGEGFVVDPGADPQKIVSFCQEMDLTITHILNTHGHFDHIGADNEIREHTGASVYIHPLDAEMLREPSLNYSLIYGGEYRVTQYVPLEEMQLCLAGKVWEIIHTPGHSRGSICLVTDSWIFGGDLIFREGIGRTDLPGGSWEEMKESMIRFFHQFQDDMIIFPGHGERTTVGHERAHNYFIRQILGEETRW